jgi:hypothetical protein
MPLSEYWTPPECYRVCMNVFEWVLKTALTYWVGMNAFEWARTAPEYPLSVRECLWVSIFKVWMRTFTLVNLTNLKGWFKLRVWTLASILDIMLRVNGYGKTFTAFLGHCQDTYGTSVLHCLVTVYFNMKEIVWKTSGSQKLVYLAICFVINYNSPSSW